MRWRHAALLFLTAALASCAAEGGSRGSGIETFILGNVTSVESVQPAGNAIEGIHVAIEGTDIKDTTDAGGNFSLQGDFDGDVTVVFKPAEPSGTARFSINVPAAGTLTMNNVHLSLPTEAAEAETVNVDFEGVVVGIDCGGMTLTLISAQQNPPDSDQYTVHLDTSSLLDADGNPLACEALREGDHLTVQGLVNPDGTFGSATLRVQP